jgi:phenylalanyl-tRNA synthetase beta chain
VDLEIDLIEEIARIFGYELIPQSLPKVKPQVVTREPRDSVSLIKGLLVSLGLNEVITYSLIDKDLLRDFGQEDPGVIEILNPLSLEQEILRPHLIPSLSRCIAYNLNQKQDYVNIFEIANIFSKVGTGPKEELRLGIGLSGTKSLLLEQGLIKEEVGFLHLKGILEALFARLGIKGYSFQQKEDADLIDILLCQEKIGVMVRLKRPVLEKLDIKNKDVFALELSLERALAGLDLEKKFIPPPKYPSITRDISLILKEDIALKGIFLAMEDKGRPYLCEVRVKDYYKGKQIPAGHRGLTLSCVYRSDARTLTEAEIAPLHALVCGALSERFEAKIR